MAIMDYNTGIYEATEKGKEEGERKSKIEIAKKLLKMRQKNGNSKKNLKKSKKQVKIDNSLKSKESRKINYVFNSRVR